MPFSEVLQLFMPSLFPLKAFEEFVTSTSSVILPSSEARREFGGASNLIGWRFRACVEDKEGYMLHGGFTVLIFRLTSSTFESGFSLVPLSPFVMY